MKDKIKARYNAIKNDPYQRGVLVGGVIGITATLASAVAFRANFDTKGVYIPDHLVDHIYATGLPAMCVKNGRQVMIGPS